MRPYPFNNFFCLDGDGRISWEELGYVMKTLGHRVSEGQLKEIMKLIDENGNGEIEFEEVSLFLSLKKVLKLFFEIFFVCPLVFRYAR